jgi:hypothetical protein
MRIRTRAISITGTTTPDDVSLASVGKGRRARRSSSPLLALTACSALFAIGCATKRPVLYPNDHLKMVGNEMAQVEIKECEELATDSGAGSSKAGAVATNTVGGAAVGGASGAVGGAIWGSPGRGAAGGAAAGATAGLIRGLFQTREPDPVFRGFVERCLRDRGYDTIGWK